MLRFLLLKGKTMAIDTGFAKGKYAGLYVSAPQSGIATEPVDVTYTISGAVSAGATSITIDGSIASNLQVGTILNFGGVKVVVTTAVAVGTSGGTAVAVDAPYGDVGDGVGAIADAETAVWDQLHWVKGTTDTPLSVTGAESSLSSVTYDNAENAEWTDSEILSQSWGTSRTGNRKADDYAGTQIRTVAYNPAAYELWVKIARPREDGSLAETIEGRVGIPNYSDAAPVQGIVTESITFTGRGQPKRTIVAAS